MSSYQNALYVALFKNKVLLIVRFVAGDAVGKMSA